MHYKEADVKMHKHLRSTRNKTSKSKKTTKSNARVSKSDLSELVLDPLANQIDKVRLDLLSQLKKANDSLDILAREKARELKKGNQESEDSICV